MREEARTILLEAATTIERIGWVPNCYAIDDKHGLLFGDEETVWRIGMLGALLRASVYDILTPAHDLYHASRWLVRKFLGVTNLAEWEGAKGRTKEEVLAALRGAANIDDEPPCAPGFGSVPRYLLGRPTPEPLDPRIDVT